MTASALYCGRVRHARSRPMRHKLSYRVFMALFDVDELPELARTTHLFAHNRAAMVAFYDRDHGDGSGAPLRPQMEARLRESGIAFDGGAIRVLCMPRLFGFVFNPLSVYYCYTQNGALAAIIYEVNNTFGERAFYTLAALTDGDAATVHQACDKTFRVSPFLHLGLRYRFAVRPPADHLSIAIIADDATGPILTASFAGARRPLSSPTLIREILTHPLMTLGVVVAIHWEGLQIWLKGKSAARRVRA